VSEPEPNEIDLLIEQLRGAIERQVHQEQLVDKLTRLGNDEALSNWIEQQLSLNKDFWLAFVEVDKFKDINDAFGYANADELLRAIAEELTRAKPLFKVPPTPFRAHGDEFFIGGQEDKTDLNAALETLRVNIAAIGLPVDVGGNPKTMSGTVSIGWLAASDTRAAGGEILTGRRVRELLEQAVAEAKITRNKVIKYDLSMAKATTCKGRADCGGCRTKFEVTIVTDNLSNNPLRCPQCGNDVDRPFSLRPQQPQ
jgi:diguanylate cyclase (GGDEF)-like protein